MQTESVSHISLREPLLLAVVTVAMLGLSAVGAKDYFTWFLEVLPILIGLPLLVVTSKGFPLTPLVYRLLFLHALILMIGGHYTYAEVPIGFWAQRTFGFVRNHYDRLGHFMQGFVPALLAREFLLRLSPLVPGKWTFFLVTCVCLAMSASYELFEWATAITTGAAADAFLGTQGDIWDTQWDMFWALIGAITAQVMLGRIHDHELRRFRTG